MGMFHEYSRNIHLPGGNRPNKLEKINFKNIVAMKISAVFECDSTNNSSSDTNLDTVRLYQKRYLK